MRKFLLIGVFFLISPPLQGIENSGFNDWEEGWGDERNRQSCRPQGKEALKFLKKQLSSCKKGKGVGEEELLNTTLSILRAPQAIPFSLLEKVIDVLRWRNAKVLLNLKAQMYGDLYEAVEDFLETRCYVQGWSAEADWMDQTYGFFRDAGYEVRLEWHQDLVSFVEKTMFARAKFNRVLRPVRRMKALILQAYQGPIQKTACKAMKNVFFYSDRINLSIRIIRLFPALVKFIQKTERESPLRTYFSLVISDITAAYHPERRLTCAQRAFEYMIFGLQGYDPELDAIFHSFTQGQSPQAEFPQADVSQEP